MEPADYVTGVRIRLAQREVRTTKPTQMDDFNDRIAGRVGEIQRNVVAYDDQGCVGLFCRCSWKVGRATGESPPNPSPATAPRNTPAEQNWLRVR